ncbi:MAG: M1 family aminopeptidase [Bacteroidota bacterium]
MMKYFLLLAILLASCSTTKVSNSEPDIDEIYVPDIEEEFTEERLLEELQVVAPRGYALETYNSAETRHFDLIHTDLNLQFDWSQEKVIGTAQLRLRPYFYAQNYLILDAKGMEIRDVRLPDGESLTYQYNGQHLDIELNQKYTREEEVVIIIDYIADPSNGVVGGSAAITSDKGLFFINSDGSQPNKPQQIWTQGETENNSRWFPTIDHPNENMTQSITMTVEERFETLSNGTLISSKSNGDGTRTDRWEMDEPHAPYLAMVAVGEFAVVREEWNGIDLEYYVEPAYKPYAKQIFAHTAEMIEFFSTILDFPFPWDKYSQVIVRDFVSGAMENTTAVVFGDFIQKTDRELIDDDNDYIVAHEMFHHWFGDLVTCESWANLTLQEGFANYSEYLWKEHKYGIEEADFHRYNERLGYFGSIMQTGIHPLIHYGYDDKEDMFDGHSYNKGGLVLHMLRDMLGDDAFFAGLNKYLTDNQYSAVEVDELRMAFEDVSGLDLNWFFDQWYHAAGHPVLDIEYSYNEVSKELIVDIDQTQDPEANPPIFQLPIAIATYDESGRERIHQIRLQKRTQQVRLDCPTNPVAILFDHQDRLLMIKNEVKSPEQYIAQYQYADAYAHRHEAIRMLTNETTGRSTLQAALSDPHFSIRVMAVNALTDVDSTTLQLIANLGESDPHSAVRSAALMKLFDQDADMALLLVTRVLEKEQSYGVIATGLSILRQSNYEGVQDLAAKFKDANVSTMISTVSEILASSGDPTHLSYFEEKLTSVSLYSVLDFYESYYELLRAQPTSTQLQKAKLLKGIATAPDSNMYYKLTSANTINKLREDLLTSNADAAESLYQMIEEIKSQETNELLLERYSAF